MPQRNPEDACYSGPRRICVECCDGEACPLYGHEHTHVSHRCDSRHAHLARLRAQRDADGYHHPDLPR